jgi:hypothetical protein
VTLIEACFFVIETTWLCLHLPFILLAATNMRLHGTAFSGSKRGIQLVQHLRVIAGNAMWFSTFDPINNPFPNETFFLLRELFQARLCFFLTGSFVYCMAGIFQGYSGASLFIALTDTPLNKLLFQLEGDEIETFWIGGFEFHLLESEPEADLFICEITKGDLVWTYPRLRASSVVLTSFTSFGRISKPHITNDTLSPSSYPTLPMATPRYCISNIIGQVPMAGKTALVVPCAFLNIVPSQGIKPYPSCLAHAPVRFVRVSHLNYLIWPYTCIPKWFIIVNVLK